MKYKSNWQETKEHFEAFWDRSYLDRCNLAMAVPASERKERKLSREYTLEERYTNPQCIHEGLVNSYANREFLYESLPAHYLNFGTAGQCEYFGCVPQYAETTIWFDPILKEPDLNSLKMEESGRKRFERHKKIAFEMAALSKDKYLVAMPDNCGIIDCLAEIRGTNNLLMDMVENPDFVHEARERIIQVWKDTEREFHEILKESNDGGSSHGWMQLWCPGSHVQIQCDYSVMISPQMFEKFVLPELEETAGVFDYTTYHLDGVEQLRHLDMILSVKGITNIQWTPVASQPKTSFSIEALQKIQKAGKGLVLIPDISEVEFLLKNLSHKGLHLVINGVKDQNQAEWIEKMAKEFAHD